MGKHCSIHKSTDLTESAFSAFSRSLFSLSVTVFLWFWKPHFPSKHVKGRSRERVRVCVCLSVCHNLLTIALKPAYRRLITPDDPRAWRAIGWCVYLRYRHIYMYCQKLFLLLPDSHPLTHKCWPHSTAMERLVQQLTELDPKFT